jgi:hypothetical protein
VSRSDGDKTGQALLVMATKEPAAVDWMEAKSVQRRGIADIMQECCRYQRVARSIKARPRPADVMCRHKPQPDRGYPTSGMRYG